MKLVIIGGVAGGASAAARARRLSEDAEIVLFERGSDPSFANCGLPYYIGGEIRERNKLLVAPIELLVNRLALDVRVRTEVIAIDRAAKTITARNLATGEEYQEAYDKLILSPGARPFKPPIPGIELPGVHTLRDLSDADRLQELARKSRRAVILGGGFIGLEMAENLVGLGIEITLIELADQIMPPLDREITMPIQRELTSRGIELKLSDSITEITSGVTGLRVKLKSGQELPTDLVLVSVGVRPENQLAEQAGLPLGKRGGIQVNEHLQTSDPDIYAVGDAVETYDFMTLQPTQVPLAGPANRQGRLAADHIFGREARYRGTQGTAIVGLFGKTAAMTGLSEKAAQRLGLEYKCAYVHPNHHAGYYPGAETMTLKMLYSPQDGRILGAQGVGGAGVDKRIDVIATAIQAGLTVFDLEEIELCYAPQFGSAKDPVNMLGFVASGELRGDHPQVRVDQLESSTWSEAQVLDVRTPREFAAGHIPHALNISVDELRQRLTELPRDKPIVAYCQVGMRGYLATRILLQHGFSVVNLSGGYTTWRMFHPA